MTRTNRFRPPRHPSREAVERLAAEHRRRLVAFAFALTGRLNESEDIVQDVLLRLSTKTDLNTEVIDLPAYARRAIVNEVHSWRRRLARQRQRQSQLESEWVRALKVEPDPYDRVEVLQALRSLNARERAAVVLHYFSDATDEEASATLGCAPATVRSLRSRATKKLRVQLQPSRAATPSPEGSRNV